MNENTIPNQLPADFDFAGKATPPASLPPNFEFASDAPRSTLPANFFDATPSKSQALATAKQSATPTIPGDSPALVKMGEMIPESATGVLNFANRYLVQPFDKAAEWGSRMGAKATEPILPLSEADKTRLQSQGVEVYQAPQWAKGVEQGIFETAGSTVADPRNWPFFASSAARPLLQRLISGGFATQMGTNAISAAHTLYKQWDDLNPQQRAEIATQGGLTALMAGAAGTHAINAGRVKIGTAETTPEVPKVDASKVTVGPGAKNAGTTEVGGSELAQLTDTIRGKQISPEAPSLTDQASKQVSQSLQRFSDSVSSTWESAHNVARDLWESYKNPPQWTDFKNAVGTFQGDLQKSDWELKLFSDEIKDAVPDKDRRVAITNWIQANGDENLLRQRADASAPEHRGGYETALRLTDEEQNLARNIQNHFEAKFAEAQRLGMLSHAIENYIPQVWDTSDNPTATKLRAAAAFNELQPNPSFLKQRIFDSYFDGEQAGFAPRDKDVGALIANYNQAFNNAIASRAFIRSLHEGTASDGRPLVEVAGTGSRVDTNGVPPNDVDSYFIRPKVKPEDALDYKVVDHPALRGWKWATSDADGHPIFVQGDMLVHPEVADKLQNILGPSAIRQSAIGRGLLKASSAFKQTLLSLSLFHQTQIGVHALEHTVNPFRLDALDLNDATQRALVDHGLMVSDFHGMSEFAEGVSGTGLVSKVPLLGSKMAEYQDYLFRDYIPRVKMAMAQEALERNTARYGDKLSRDQILELTANQANAAFGHLNYKLLARNPTFQDAFRLLALAPDFLEARARFVGQALKPYGREQMRALALGATAMAAGKFVIGQLTGDEQDWHPNHLFFVKIGGREYGFRTIQGDLAHMATDPRNFVSNRLNPALTRPLLEAVTGRDQWSRQRDVSQQVQDYYKTAVPIPLKGLMKSSPQDITDTALQSIGIQERKYKRQRVARQIAARKAQQ